MQTTQDKTLQETMESAFAEIGAQGANYLNLLKAYILTNETKTAAEANLEILKPQVESLRLKSTEMLGVSSDDIRVLEYFKDDNGKRLTPKKVAFVGKFRNKAGEYVISHVQKDAQRSVKVEDVEALFEEGIISLAVKERLINQGKASSHNLVRFVAGRAK